MPGIAMDGSEDLPNRFISDTPTRLGICPFCYECATHMNKDMVGTHFCKNGHKWESAYSLLAIPSNAYPRIAPPENCIYGVCPTCSLPGILRARDVEGTTHCRNGHEWKTHPVKMNQFKERLMPFEQKPLATEQKPVYDPSHQVIQDLLKQIESLTKRVVALEAETGLQEINEYRNYRDQQTELYIGQGYGRKLAKGMAHHDCNLKFGKR